MSYSWLHSISQSLCETIFLVHYGQLQKTNLPRPMQHVRLPGHWTDHFFNCLFFLYNDIGLLVKWFIRLSTLCYNINASLTWHLISWLDFGDTLPSKQHQKWSQLGHKMCLPSHPPSVVFSHAIVCRHTCTQTCWWNVYFHVKTPIWLEHSCTACYSSAYWLAHFHYMPIVGDRI